MFAGKSLGAKYSADGYTPKKPVMIIPGLCSSCLKVVESPYEAWKGKRIWLSMSSIGFDKVWDLMFLGRKKKTNKGASGEAMADVDVDLKRRWIAHMCLADDGISDPEGIKLRPVKGLKGCKYLDPGALTDALSYVMGPVAEMLEDLGYVDGHNLDASPYDWRLPPYKLEERDGYFSELAKRIETMYNDSGEQKVVLIAHSLGNRVVHYFARFMEKKVGRWWFSKYVDNWLAIGPLWLGAPKLLRAMVTGDRMGLEAFLFPHEGIQLGRSLGSTAWMFPYICPSDHEFSTYCKLNLNGKFVDKSNIEILSEGGAKQVSQRYLDYYEGDPLYGKQEEMFNAPPVDKIYAIYGINLKTETFYFFKHSKSKKKITDFVLDSSGSMSNFKCEGGIAFETKNTRQNVLRGQKRGGDGTVPYPSLSFCKRWKGQVNVKIAEIEGAEHREILKNKTFLQLVLEYVAQAPPPSLLPVTFTDAEYKVKFDVKGKYLDRVLALDKQYIRIKQTSGKGEIRKYYSNISNIILDEDGGNSFFIEYEDSSKVATFQSEQSAAIVQDIAARCRYIAEAKASYTEDRNEYGQTALHTAAIQNDINATISLLKGATDVNAVDLNGNTPLIVAAEKGSLDLMIVLLQAANIDVNKKANNSKTVIHHMCGLRVAQDNAAKEKWSQVMSVLKSNNVDVNAVAEFGETALHQACKRGNLDVTRWLLKNNALVNATNAAGETPLHYAVRVGRKDLIELLLQNGADRHKDSPTAGTPLALAQKMDPTLMTFIRDFTGSGSAVNSPAAAAARASKVEARKSLAGQAGRDEHGRTQLHLAASEDRLDRVFELLLSNANVNEEDKNGWTPLHCAASGNHLDVLTVLLNSYGVNVNAQTDSGSTVLHYLMRFPQETASSGNYVRILQQIKQKGASLNLTATRGITPLHEAALRGNKVGATWLLDEGAKLNVGSATGFTPLHLAVQGKSLDVVKLLIEHRGDHTQKSEAGTPVEMAKMVDPAIYSYLTSLPSSAPAPAPPARKKPTAPPFQTASHRRPTAPATPPSTEQESNGDDADDDEDEVIYANDEDDDETVPGANTTVIPLAQRRRSTIYHIRERQSYSVIFTKPPIGETNNLLAPNIDQKSGPQSTRGRGPAPTRGLPPGRGNVQHTRGGTSNTGGAGNGVARGQKPVSRPLASSMGQSSSGSNLNNPTNEPSTLTRSLSNDSPRGSPTVPVRGGSGSRRGTAPSRGNGGPLPATNRGSPANRLSPAPGSGSTSPNMPGSPAQMKPLQTISPAQPKIVKGPPSQLPSLPSASNGSAPAPSGGPGTKFCMQCGTKRVPNFKFCGECGLKFDN